MADHRTTGRQLQAPGELALPQLLAFYQDVIDEDLATTIGWSTVAWGLVLADGSAISIPVDGPTAVTLWHSVDDAADALDAYVDTPDPRPRKIDKPASTERARASATFSLRSSDGIAAQTACPGSPEDGDDRDRPLGNGRPARTSDTPTQGPAS